MKINYTKTYRLWFLLTSVSVLGLLVTFFAGYNPLEVRWHAFYNIHMLFIWMLLAAVVTRVYMALNSINGVPLVHLIRAKSTAQAAMALGYIALCSALLVTLGSELYLLLVFTEQAKWVQILRDTAQPVFALLVAVHVTHALVVKRGVLRKILRTSDI